MSGVDETTCGDRLETDQVAEGDWVCLSVGQEEVPEEEAPQEQPDKEGEEDRGEWTGTKTDARDTKDTAVDRPALEQVHHGGQPLLRHRLNSKPSPRKIWPSPENTTTKYNFLPKNSYIKYS
jgi:hypothetical protein